MEDNELKVDLSIEDKLLKAMHSMHNPKKDTEAYNYKYATLDQVLEIVKPALKEQGLALSQQSKFNEQTNSFCLFTNVFDGEDMRVLDIRPLHDGTNAQNVGSWETYMRRYALTTAFGLAAEDDDGEATTQGITACCTKCGTSYPQFESEEQLSQYKCSNCGGRLKAVS